MLRCENLKYERIHRILLILEISGENTNPPPGLAQAVLHDNGESALPPHSSMQRTLLQTQSCCFLHQKRKDGGIVCEDIRLESLLLHISEQL